MAMPKLNQLPPPPPRIGMWEKGMWEPILTAQPAELDMSRTRELQKFMEYAGLYESGEESLKRQEVLGRLDQIVKAWVKRLLRLRGIMRRWWKKPMLLSLHLGLIGWV